MKELEEAKEKFENLEKNDAVESLKLENEKLKNTIKEKDKQLQEFSEINQKLFLKVGQPIFNSEENEESEEEKEQRELLESAKEKLKAIQEGG